MSRIACPTPALCRVAEHDLGTRAAAKCAARNGHRVSATSLPVPTSVLTPSLPVLEGPYTPPEPRVLDDDEVKYIEMYDLLEELDGEVDEIEGYFDRNYPTSIPVLISEGYVIVEEDDSRGVIVAEETLAKFSLSRDDVEDVEVGLAPYNESVRKNLARHSVEGPVVNRANGSREWYLRGREVMPSEWLERVRGISVPDAERETVDRVAKGGGVDLDRLGEAIHAGSPVEWAIAYAEAEAVS